MNQGDMIGDLNPPRSATPTYIHILREAVITASMRRVGKGIPGTGASLDSSHGSRPLCSEGVVFSPWAMKGERPLSRFMHYAEGEAPWDRGGLVWIFPSMSVSKQGDLCQGHPEAPSRSQVDCSLLSPADLAVRPWPAGETNSDAARIVCLST
jgi:hypothetical protein